ncbi:hypothetical protein NBRC116591_31930 [Sessilibacter corallicola]|uniref:Uncharacterized protein n=2 Tax=Sessilibacter corallicola TaxID=2904075 RepID=A0ABQ0ACV8_9GAMM
MVSLPLQFDKAFAESWSLEEVVERWLQLYKGDKLIHKYESFGWKYLLKLSNITPFNILLLNNHKNR